MEHSIGLKRVNLAILDLPCLDLVAGVGFFVSGLLVVFFGVTFLGVGA